MTALYDRIQEVAAQYPESRSAIMPALRLAQEEHGGWLPPEAFREVGEALELTPAYCKAVASFYDMFQLEPVGRHMVEICTNISCALVGAQQVLEAFERELGVRGDDRGRRGDPPYGRVRRGLRLGDGGRRRPPLPRARPARGRAGDRQGAARCPLESCSSRTRTPVT